MVLFNYATKEITMKVVYYGPGLCGKTTNLQYIHSRLNPKTRGKLISLATETDRTLFFDFLPMEMGIIKGFKIRFQLYTVPGQVRYNATRKLVLKGADGVVFVADSQSTLMDQNIESFGNLKENLLLNGLDPQTIPLVFQYNKRDINDIIPVPELNEKLNYRGVPFFESIAIKGSGVLESFKEITKILLKEMAEKHRVEVKEEILPSEAPVKHEVHPAEELKINEPIIEEIRTVVEVESGIAGETIPEILGEEVSEAIEYVSPAEGPLAVEEEVAELAEHPAEIETPSVEEPTITETLPPLERFVEEKTAEHIPSVNEILVLLKEIKESLDSVYSSLYELRGIRDKLTAQGSHFTAITNSLNSIPEIRKAQESLYRRLVESDESNRRRTEEILKSFNELKGKVDSLTEKPEKKWFRIR